MRKALIVGIDYYQRLSPLRGAVNDARAVKNALERHADGTVNFAAPKMLVSADAQQLISKARLKAEVRELFRNDAEVALLYFAGHGYTEDTGGFLCAGDCQTGDDGLSLSELMTMVNSSPATNKVVILDSCHAGVVGNHSLVKGHAQINSGVTIMTASTEDQYAMETGNGTGVFTNLFVDALNGAASNLVGDVTPGGVYAHIDQSLGPWAQRPVFKTNVERFVSLRKVHPPIKLASLQLLTSLFGTPTQQLTLDPSFEPERSSDDLANLSIPAPNPVNVVVFRTLQEYAKVNLVRPVGAPHMYHAAMQSKACELTVLGRHYWNLVRKGLI